MVGQELLDTLVENTGLPPDYVRTRLQNMLTEGGTVIEDLDMEKVRTLLADLLLDLINECQDEPL
jgi:hypothetical protein